MAPSIESALFLVVTIFAIRFVLRASVSVDAAGVIALGFVVTWGHSCDHLKGLFVIAREIVIVIVCTILVFALSLKVVWIAQLQLLYPSNIVIWDAEIQFVNSLAESIALESWDGWGCRGI